MENYEKKQDNYKGNTEELLSKKLHEILNSGYQCTADISLTQNEISTLHESAKKVLDQYSNVVGPVIPLSYDLRKPIPVSRVTENKEYVTRVVDTPKRMTMTQEIKKDDLENKIENKN